MALASSAYVVCGGTLRGSGSWPPRRLLQSQGCTSTMDEKFSCTARRYRALYKRYPCSLVFSPQSWSTDILKGIRTSLLNADKTEGPIYIVPCGWKPESQQKVNMFMAAPTFASLVCPAAALQTSRQQDTAAKFPDKQQGCRAPVGSKRFHLARPEFDKRSEHVRQVCACVHERLISISHVSSRRLRYMYTVNNTPMYIHTCIYTRKYINVRS